jgi:hypothetical protein
MILDNDSAEDDDETEKYNIINDRKTKPNM